MSTQTAYSSSPLSHQKQTNMSPKGGSVNNSKIGSSSYYKLRGSSTLHMRAVSSTTALVWGKEVTMDINVNEQTSKAIEISVTHADVDWKNEAIKRVLWLAKHKKHFTSDDVLGYLEDRGIKTKNKSALGGIMRRALNNGWIKQTGFTLSRRPSRHLAPVRVWESQLNIKENEGV